MGGTSPEMEIFVAVPDAPPLTLEVEPSTSIQQVRQMIEDQLGIAPDRQTLSFEGVELQDGPTLADYGIEEGATLELVVVDHGPEDPVPTTAPPTPTTEAPVPTTLPTPIGEPTSEFLDAEAVEVPAQATLPVTGSDATLALLGVGLVAVGTSLRRFARRRA